MPTTLNLCPVEIDLCFTRADTLPFSFTIQDEAGTVIDITGGTFLLTVSSIPDPPDGTTQVFQLSGTITDGPNGVVEFQPSSANLDQSPGILYYDVQWTNASGDVRTIVKGALEIRQDVTK